MSIQDVEQHFINEIRKEEEVVKVRLENIKLKNKLKKKEAQLKSKEELAEGLHMIDFEQLKIENQTYNEKIEERNEVCSDYTVFILITASFIIMILTTYQRIFKILYNKL